ncbi:hypothetical protein H6P81_015835 [Aristolochia fimbriata]|uniref:Uncharacterized protein n=1 Tax=Aristolochia fimbriata TaxID=158543 RepID=A0AAV7E6N8_ARIFI|nr:hypothetical protein H6P81_015835 [Aristolochia fimbriata]
MGVVSGGCARGLKLQSNNSGVFGIWTQASGFGGFCRHRRALVKGRDASSNSNMNRVEVCLTGSRSTNNQLRKYVGVPVQVRVCVIRCKVSVRLEMDGRSGAWAGVVLVLICEERDTRTMEDVCLGHAGKRLRVWDIWDVACEAVLGCVGERDSAKLRGSMGGRADRSVKEVLWGWRGRRNNCGIEVEEEGDESTCNRGSDECLSSGFWVTLCMRIRQQQALIGEIIHIFPWRWSIFGPSFGSQGWAAGMEKFCNHVVARFT